MSVILAIMVQLWSCLLLLLASLCAVHTKPYPEEKHRTLLRTGYHYFPGVGYYRSVRRHFIGQLLCCTSRRYFDVCLYVCVCGGDRVSEYFDGINETPLNEIKLLANKRLFKILIRHWD